MCPRTAGDEALDVSAKLPDPEAEAEICRQFIATSKCCKLS